MNHRIVQSVVVIFLYRISSGLDVVHHFALFDFVFEVTCKKTRMLTGGAQPETCKNTDHNIYN